MTTINQISISGNNLNIFYKGGNPGPQPSASGTCIPIDNPAYNEWCIENCIPKPCTKINCNKDFCKWKPGNPCLENPCKNGGICKANTETGAFTCACRGCYKGTTCETVNCLSGCIGGEGCEAIKGSSSCECKCNENCYKIDKSTNKCKIKDCGECKGGICVCENGILKCNKKPPLDKYLVGYFCPTCPTPKELSSTDLLTTKYNIMCIAFISNESDGTLSVNDCWSGKKNSNTFCPDKSFINQFKKKNTKINYVLGSIGGADGKIVYYSDINEAYIQNFTNSALSIIKTYDLDGVDFDLENRNPNYNYGNNYSLNNKIGLQIEATTSSEYETIGLAFRQIAYNIKKQGYIVTSAPQCGNLGGCIGTNTDISSGNNELVSLFGIPDKNNITASNNMIFNKDGELNNNPFYLVFPQMYNSWSGVETTKALRTYWQNMTSNGFSNKGDLATYKVIFESSKFILGYPANTASASSGFIEPTKIVSEILEMEKDMIGAMTWDINQDWASGLNFSNTIGNHLFSS